MATLGTRWDIAEARCAAAQLAVDDAFERNAPYAEVMALIAYKANEWENFKSVLDEYAEVVKSR